MCKKKQKKKEKYISNTELRSCVEVEVDVLGSPFLIVLKVIRRFIMPGISP